MTHQASLRNRMNRVANALHADLAGPHTLESLAGIACLSKFHFVKAFAGYFRRTPVRYLWNARLENAARMLYLAPEQPIVDIALGFGFASSQSFSNAFRSRFGMAPAQFREEPAWLPTDMPIETMPEKELGSVRLEYRAAIRVAYIRHYGRYRRDVGGIPATFRVLTAWAKARGIDAFWLPRIGFCPNNRRVTPGWQCQYDACIPVPDWVHEDETVSIQTIPAGPYAVMSARCRNTQMLTLWEWMTRDWSPDAGFTCDQRWGYELFPNASVDPRGGVEICLRLNDGPTDSAI